jgi:hypothetical protein
MAHDGRHSPTFQGAAQATMVRSFRMDGVKKGALCKERGNADD